MGLFGNRIEIQYTKLLQNHRKDQRSKERNVLLQRKGLKRVVEQGSYKQKVHWNKQGVQRVVAFHWLNCDSLSLGGLFPGKEKTFLPHGGGKNNINLQGTTPPGFAVD